VAFRKKELEFLANIRRIQNTAGHEAARNAMGHSQKNLMFPWKKPHMSSKLAPMSPNASRYISAFRITGKPGNAFQSQVSQKTLSFNESAHHQGSESERLTTIKERDSAVKKSTSVSIVTESHHSSQHNAINESVDVKKLS
jgi:hypothetical protein